MKINLSLDETKDLSRQLRYLYIRELRNAGFVDDEDERPSGVARPTTWRFEMRLPEIENFTGISHTESADGEFLIRESMARVEQEDGTVPRAVTERYIAKLRDATRRMAVRQAVDWKKTVESHALRFVTHQEPLHTYLAEKIMFKLWIT
jgi:hypothetical protein